MKFEDILDDIEKLVNIPLCSINPSTPKVKIVKFDRLKKNYHLQIENSSKISSRSFSELADIWHNLALHRYVSVDQALYGVGSSRNQPETILSNLPYIQHFKYRNKKHLLLRNKNTHELGTQHELPNTDFKIIKRLIDNHKSINISRINNDFEISIIILEKNINFLKTRYGGDQSIYDLENTLLQLKKIQQEIESTIVSVDDTKEIENPQETIYSEDEIKSLRPENIIDSPIFTGVDDGNEDNDEDNDENDVSTKIVDSSTLSAIERFIRPNFRRQTPTFSLLYERLQFNEIEMQPAYQRKDRIWPPSQRSKLIESILIGLPLPTFYFGERTNGNWIIIDGLQRLTTVQDFLSNKFALRDLEDVKLNGLKFNELNRLDKRKIREFEITAYIVDTKEDTEKFVIELFHRINTYGMKLSNQEIRTAINLGSSTSYLKYLATRPSFINATNKKVNTDRQKDLELCLAALAYMLLGYKNYEYGKYDEFLGRAMKELNKEDFNLTHDTNNTFFYNSKSNLLEKMTSRFLTALDFSSQIFNENAFKKTSMSEKSEPLSKPLFELIVSVFSNLTEVQMDSLKTNKEKFTREFYAAIENDSKEYSKWTSEIYEKKVRGFNYSISQSTGKRVTILYRFDAFIKMLEKYIQDEIVFTPFLKN